MLIERIIFLYNPFDREKELKLQKEIEDVKKEEIVEPILDKKLISIEEIKNEEEEQRRNVESLLKSEKKYEESKIKIKNPSFAKKIVKENIFKYPIFYKFLFQIILLICVGYFVFIYMPTNGTNDFYPLKHKLDGSVYFIKGNSFLDGFYFIYCVYFTISSYQIKS